MEQNTNGMMVLFLTFLHMEPFFQPPSVLLHKHLSRIITLHTYILRHEHIHGQFVKSNHSNLYKVKPDVFIYLFKCIVYIVEKTL